MIPAAFDYARPRSVDEAIRLLSEGSGSKVIAGGQSLLPLLKLRLAAADRLVDIGRLDDLRFIRATADGGLAIGALTTYRDLLDSADATGRYPILAEAIDGIGDVQVRNRGTVGGALAHADPSSDLPAVALALDGTVVLRSPEGERVVAATDFFRGAFATACGERDILTELRLPPIPQGAGSAYRRLEQPASGYSMVGIAAVVGHAHGVLGSATFDHIRVGVTGVAEAPYRATDVEAALLGTACDTGAIAAAARMVTTGREVNSDIHAGADYRTAMAEVYTRRALEAARARSA